MFVAILIEQFHAKDVKQNQKEVHMNRTQWYELNAIINKLREFNKDEQWSDIDDVIGDLLALRTEIADEVLYTEFKK